MGKGGRSAEVGLFGYILLPLRGAQSTVLVESGAFDYAEGKLDRKVRDRMGNCRHSYPIRTTVKVAT
jgi:hypothetical protein